MTSRRLAVVRGLLAALVAAAAAALPAAPSAAAACEQDEGVTVVVDFGPLGGEHVACSPGDPATGLEALQRAGFSTERAALERSAYFICRVDGLPADAACGRAASGDAYWSYWHGRPGAGWTYSGSAVSAHDPAPGSVEGFAFGAGAPPDTGPPAPVAPSSTSSTTSATTPGPARSSASSGGVPTRPDVQQRTTSAAAASEPAASSATSGTSRPPTSQPSISQPSTTTPPTTAPSPSGATSPSATSPPRATARDDDQDLAAAPVTTSATPPSGTPAGPLVAAALVALLAGAAGWQVLRRRPRGG